MTAELRAWRFGVAGRPAAPWRPSAEEARWDAVDAGYLVHDEQRDRWFWMVLGEIWATGAYVLTKRRVAGPQPQNGPTSTEEPTRIDRIIARREGRKSAAN